MKARLQIGEKPDHIIIFDTGMIEVHCLACKTWVKLEDLRETVFEDGCKMSWCPHCGALSNFAEGPCDREVKCYYLSYKKEKP